VELQAAVAEAAANGQMRPAGDVIGSLDDILGIDDRQYETVHIAEWGRSVRLVSIDGLARNRIATAMRKANKTIDESNALEFQCRLIVESMVNEAGEHIGSQAQAPALMEKNNAVIVRLFLVCARLSGVGEDAAVEALEALKATPSADTGSD
jgi:hypothetical protein